MKSFGECVKELREGHGWSQRELARRTGLSNAEICRIETGQRKDPGIRTLCRLCMVFDVTRWLLIEPINDEVERDMMYDKGRK